MKLQATKRDADTKLALVRGEGSIPAVCYGPDVESIAIAIHEREFTKMARDISTATIIDLDIEGEEHEVLVKQIDREPVSEDIQHVDFYAIKRGVEMEIEVPIVFVGESRAAKSGGVLNEVLHELQIRCRPRDLVEQVEIDLSLLEEVGSSITVADVRLREGITVLNGAEETIVSVNAVVEEVEGGSVEDMAEVLADKTVEGAE